MYLLVYALTVAYLPNFSPPKDANSFYLYSLPKFPPAKYFRVRYKKMFTNIFFHEQFGNFHTVLLMETVILECAYVMGTVQDFKSFQ